MGILSRYPSYVPANWKPEEEFPETLTVSNWLPVLQQKIMVYNLSLINNGQKNIPSKEYLTRPLLVENSPWLWPSWLVLDLMQDLY